MLALATGGDDYALVCASRRRRRPWSERRGGLAARRDRRPVRGRGGASRCSTVAKRCRRRGWAGGTCAAETNRQGLRALITPAESERSCIAAPCSLSLPLALAAGGGRGPDQGRVGQYVDLSPVALPIVDRRPADQLRLRLRPGEADAVGGRAAPARQGALFPRRPGARRATARPSPCATDYTKLDEARLKAALLPGGAGDRRPGRGRPRSRSCQAAGRCGAPVCPSPATPIH